MAEFLTTRGTAHRLENIIIQAKTKLVIVSPYLKLSKIMGERLEEASERQVAIKMVYRKSSLSEDQNEFISGLKNTELYSLENLHAKCYLNENQLIITSMNMYEFSEQHNREMGILLERGRDQELFQNAVAEVGSILKAATPERLPSKKRNDQRSQKKTNKRQETGYCIRCAIPINLNASRPYCGKCFSIWQQFENFDYEENVCHSCGKDKQTSMAQPECYSCVSDDLPRW